jgi:hypothetical protein
MADKPKRGRPKKIRPNRGEITPGMSQRDLVAAFPGITRRSLQQALMVASIPTDEFEALVERDNPASISELLNLVRRRTGKSTERIRRCPHCGVPLRIEDVT